jgi:hypothetical protein
MQTKDKMLLQNAGPLFYNYPVLGSLEVLSDEEKNELINVFSEGIGKSEKNPARCFIPRHGLRISSSAATADFIICFECSHVLVHGFIEGSHFLTNAFARGFFNELLDQYYIKRHEDNVASL